MGDGATNRFADEVARPASLLANVNRGDLGDSSHRLLSDSTTLGLATHSRQGRDDTLANAVSDGMQSALHSALQAPTDGVLQIVDHTFDTKLSKGNPVFAQPETAEFGTKRWHAQQIGAAGGMILPFLVVAKGTRGVFSKFEGSAVVAEGATLSKGAKGMAILEQGVNGFIFDSVLRPSNPDSQHFWKDRFNHGLVGAATFSTLTASSIGLRGLMGKPGSNALGNFVQRDLATGALSGIPAGLVSAHGNSLVEKGHLASSKESFQGAYTMAFIGAGLSGLHVIPGKRLTLAERIADGPGTLAGRAKLAEGLAAKEKSLLEGDGPLGTRQTRIGTLGSRTSLEGKMASGDAPKLNGDQGLNPFGAPKGPLELSGFGLGNKGSKLGESEGSAPVDHARVPKVDRVEVKETGEAKETGDGKGPVEAKETGDGKGPVEAKETGDGKGPVEAKETGDGKGPVEAKETGDGKGPVESKETGDGKGPVEAKETGEAKQEAKPESWDITPESGTYTLGDAKPRVKYVTEYRDGVKELQLAEDTGINPAGTVIRLYEGQNYSEGARTEHGRIDTAAWHPDGTVVLTRTNGNAVWIYPETRTVEYEGGAFQAQKLEQLPDRSEVWHTTDGRTVEVYSEGHYPKTAFGEVFRIDVNGNTRRYHLEDGKVFDLIQGGDKLTLVQFEGGKAKLTDINSFKEVFPEEANLTSWGTVQNRTVFADGTRMGRSDGREIFTFSSERKLPDGRSIEEGISHRDGSATYIINDGSYLFNRSSSNLPSWEWRSKEWHRPDGAEVYTFVNGERIVHRKDGTTHESHPRGHETTLGTFTEVLRTEGKNTYTAADGSKLEFSTDGSGRVIQYSKDGKPTLLEIDHIQEKFPSGKDSVFGVTTKLEVDVHGNTTYHLERGLSADLNQVTILGQSRHGIDGYGLTWDGNYYMFQNGQFVKPAVNAQTLEHWLRYGPPEASHREVAFTLDQH